MGRRWATTLEMGQVRCVGQARRSATSSGAVSTSQALRQRLVAMFRYPRYSGRVGKRRANRQNHSPRARAAGVGFAVLCTVACGGNVSGDAGNSGGGGGTSGGAADSGRSDGGNVGGGASGGSGGASGGGQGGKSGHGGHGGDACETYKLQATPAELSKTPRPDADAEILALEAANTFIAPDALYNRIASERASIVASEPAVGAVHPRTTVYRPNPLRVEFSPSGWQAVAAGTYNEWNCPNQAYGAVPTLNTQWEFVNLEFGGKRFHSVLLGKEYTALPNVTKSYQDTYFYDGPDVCLEIQGDQHFYIFDDASNDCPSGCMYHRYFGFHVATAGGAVTKLGTYVYDTHVASTEPEWFTKLVDCRARL